MKLQLLRNATMLLNYGGSVILTDPMLSDKGVLESFAGIERNPTVSLAVSAETLQADFVLATHTHLDHFDPAAVNILNDTPVLIPENDKLFFSEIGLKKLISIREYLDYRGIRITRIGGRHGRGPVLKLMGEVSGFILEAEKEPKVYWIGDSVWCDDVEDAVRDHNPDIIITHSGGAEIPGFENKILMDEDETLHAVETAPNARIVAIHMESLDHCTVTRQGLRRAANAKGIDNRLLIPENGEVIDIFK